jgi:heme/copper-type cytochrome/quinol oxidase subunit 2
VGVALVSTLGLAACGSDHDSGMGGGQGHMDGGMGAEHMEEDRAVVPGAREIAITANALTFTPKVIQVLTGEDVTIALTSKDIAHDLYVKGVGHIVHAAKGETAKGGLRIDKAGTYQFWCTVSGHKEGGMRGVLTVTS